MNKRRKDKRAVLKKPVLLNGNIKAMGINLSEGGIYVRTSHSFPVGTMLEIELPIEKGLKFRARVQHALDGAGMGLMFIGIPFEQRIKLRSFLKELSEEPENQPGSNKKRILIIEEDPVQRRILKSKLLLDGYMVVESDDGFMGIHMLQVEKVDLVLMNLEMKKLDAFKTLYLIRNNPSWKRLPVLALALRASPETLDKANKAGVTELLTTITPEMVSQRVLANLDTRI